MIARRAVLPLPVLIAARCAKPPPPPPPAPPVLELSLRAGPGQNPDPGGRPGPVAVRLYFLKAASAFERVDWYALTERERAALGEDVAATEEVVLTPGEARTITRRLEAGVRFVGVAVGFREIDRAGWRALQPVAENGTTKLVLHTAGTSAVLASA